jgi:hypothetical protein
MERETPHFTRERLHLERRGAICPPRRPAPPVLAGGPARAPGQTRDRPRCIHGLALDLR